MEIKIYKISAIDVLKVLECYPEGVLLSTLAKEVREKSPLNQLFLCLFDIKYQDEEFYNLAIIGGDILKLLNFNRSNSLISYNEGLYFITPCGQEILSAA